MENNFWTSGAKLFLLLLIVPTFTATYYEQYSQGVNDLLNTCMDAQNHKSQPGPENSLHSQCIPWYKRSCCTVNTTVHAHHYNMYNFDWSHCVQPLSAKCRKHFQQDLCFYECSPNVGPWLVGVKQKIRNQRFINVPLCRSDCDAWFKDCLEDYTCTDNWGRNFRWTKDGNKCPTGASCQKFGEIYNNNASYFCETVWDHSWKVVDNSDHCMRLWFDPAHGNPNDAVAKWKAEQVVEQQLREASGAVVLTKVPSLIIFTASFLFNMLRFE